MSPRAIIPFSIDPIEIGITRNHKSCFKVTAPSPSNSGYRSKREQAPTYSPGTLLILFRSTRNACMRACVRASVTRYDIWQTLQPARRLFKIRRKLYISLYILSNALWMRACRRRFNVERIKTRCFANNLEFLPNNNTIYRRFSLEFRYIVLSRETGSYCAHRVLCVSHTHRYGIPRCKMTRGVH